MCDITDITMGQILIRNLDDSTIAGLKRRAELNRTSAEEEARRALASSVAFDAEAWRQRAQAVAERIGVFEGPSSTELLREERNRDDTP
jgi:plasmid stability protein